MGSKGGPAPNPYTQRRASTIFLRVPVADWPRVVIGEKTEFRTRPAEGSSLLNVNTPTPVVAYTVNRLGHKAQLMVLLEHRHEPLFAISEDAEAVAREGFASYDEFRRYWRARRRGKYRPMEMVHVFRVRPWDTDDDHIDFGMTLLGHLYGDFMPERPR